MSWVRTFVQEDIPQVATLKWRFLHNGSGPPPPTMESYFRELFFHGPFSEKTLPSLVCENERGRVVGFLGISRRRMSFHGKPTEAAVGSSLVVDPESRSTMAGLKLIKCFLSGKQDLAMTDTANQVTQQLWTRLGGSTASLYSIHWSRPLRPAQYAAYAASRLRRGPLSRAFVLSSKPICKIVDAIATRILSSPFLQKPSSITEEELTVETLLACMRDFSEPGSLRPEYDRDSVKWLLDFMGQMNAFGSLRKVLLRNKASKIIGWYLYYLNRGGLGEVVQVGASHSSVKAVLDHLSYDAWTHGAVALHGRLDSYLLQESLGKSCFYFLGNRLLVHSRDPELARHIQAGSAFLSRLDGEWCLRFGRTDSGLTTQNMGRGLKLSTFESVLGEPTRFDPDNISWDISHNSPLDRRGGLPGGVSRRLNGEPR